ncbi:uncharacterized protein [Anoplolepis gracilipes]|uniref:uncharacterized protein n=1 Tax=Anoplolepis gracilipes TaxID=354296 RepID=UPI003BA383D6
MIHMRIITESVNCEPYNYIVDAMVDSGSPINLVRSDVIPGESYLLREESDQFCGINGSRLRIDGVFFGVLEISGVRIRMKFYTVPSNTMAYNVLLGRDFLNCPRLCFTFGKTLKVTDVEEARAINQLMHIKYDDDFTRPCDELKVNPGIGEDVSARIGEAYRSVYLENLQAEKCVPNFEMVIAHEQPISSRPRRISLADKEILQRILDELLERTIIRSSCSPYASSIVLVKKKDGGHRLCVDYRELNKITVRDNFPTELIDDNIACGIKYIFRY